MKRIVKLVLIAGIAWLALFPSKGSLVTTAQATTTSVTLSSWTNPTITGGSVAGGRTAATAASYCYIQGDGQVAYNGTVNQIQLYLNADASAVSVSIGSARHVTNAATQFWKWGNHVDLTVTGTGNTLLTFNAPTDFTAFTVLAGDYPSTYTTASTGTLKRGAGTGPVKYYNGDNRGGSVVVYSTISSTVMALAFSGTTNIWYTACTNQPDAVYFDGVAGQPKTGQSGLLNARDWYWSSGTIYVVAASDPGTLYSIVRAVTFSMVGAVQKYASNAVYAPTNGDSFRDVVHVGSTYYGYFERLNGSKWDVELATSSDGLSWGAMGSNLLAYGASGQPDEYGHADPTVRYEGGTTWKMWTDEFNASSHWVGICYSTSTDGSSWSRQSESLTLGATYDWDDNFIHHPSVIKIGSTYFMYYSGAQVASSTTWHIGLATSTDGTTWTKYSGNPIIPAGASGFDSYLIRPSKPFKVNGVWHMIYWAQSSGTSGTGTWGLAVSLNGYDWVKKGQIATGSGWDDGMQAISPLDSTNPVILYYCGYGTGTYRLGFAWVNFYTTGGGIW